ncbi:hypothetical protein GCM10009424_30680 [Sphingomonas ursincola]|uniref:Putative tail fiber protein gp53-like C-terminal domain-containing protein n=1 Tax=Sphingomonas ursincola TaxID=56361 RepID=A0A7V8RB43_9SPHN|nr:hypothetical protein [Sphingomonas ursincola]MBA1373202.1 hypothetical protein [Sphingomonas ursincola]
MAALAMMITNAGLDAIVAAESGGTDEIRIIEIGLTATPFIAAPTLDALPGEFKRIDAVSGQAVSENVIHVTAYDPSADVYDVTGIGIYTDAGVLLAVYSAAADAVLSKAQLATGLIMFDIAFANNMAALIEFGDALFLNPPASEAVKGVAEIATNAEADAGVDDTRIMSPKKTKRVLDALAMTLNAAFLAFQGTVNAAITALQGRTISGGGLVTGGGNLTANRVLTVIAASQADARTGTAGDRALTPASLGPMNKSLSENGYCTIPTADPANTLLIQWGRFSAGPNSQTSVSFPTSFTGNAFSVVVDGTSDTSNDAQDNYPSVRPGTISATGFQVHNANATTDACCFIAIGRIDLS